MFGDGPELTAAAVLNTVAHPPGYPLWILLGHLASLFPAGPLPFRINLTACLYHALTAGLVYCSAYILTRRALPSLFAAVVLAIGSPLFFVWSLQAEVFSLTDLFAAAIGFFTLLWLDDPRRWRIVVPLGALFGLALSHQSTLALLAPGALWALWNGRREIPRRLATLGVFALAATLMLLGFTLPYAHTIFASQQLAHWQLGSATNLTQLNDVIERKDYGGAFSLVAFSTVQGGTFLERVCAMLSNQGWSIAISFAGVLTLGLRRRCKEFAVAVSYVALPMLLFCAIANISVSNDDTRAIFARFALLSLTALAPFSAVAIAELAATPLQVAALAAASVIAASRLPALSLAGTHDVRTLYRDIFAALPPNAVLLTAGDAVDQPPLYFQGVEHQRPDVTVITYGLLNNPHYLQALRSQINVPPEVIYNVRAQVRRDMLALENPNRQFFTVGERPIHAPGPRYVPEVLGIVTQQVLKTRTISRTDNYKCLAQLQSVNGYGDVTADYWRSNGFGSAVRQYYAGGFFTTGYIAELLHNSVSALTWYERANGYDADPLIVQHSTTVFSRLERHWQKAL